MTVLSVLRPLSVSTLRNCLRVAVIPKIQIQQPQRLLGTSVSRYGGGGHERTMVIIPSRYQWQKYKDLVHFYLMLGLIPVLAIVFYTNVFIGPATLEEVPPGYRPKHWEYERHPISRAIWRYFLSSPQEIYERNLHYIQELDELRRCRKLEQKVKAIMSERGDYPNWYNRELLTARYARSGILEHEFLKTKRGDM